MKTKKLLSISLAFLLLCVLIPVVTKQAKAYGDCGKTIATTENDTFVIKSDETLWGFGSNNHGQLGDGTTQDRETPVKILSNVKTVACGPSFTMAIKDDYTLWGWGQNNKGQMAGSISGDSSLPVKIMDHVVLVSAGYGHVAAIKTDGSLWTWGMNECGQLGNGITKIYQPDPDDYQSEPVKIMDNVVSVSAGSDNTMAITNDGSLWAWGDNENGQLGNNGAGNVGTGSPIPVNGLPYCQTTPVKVMDNVLSIEEGFCDCSFALKKDGSLWACGLNRYGGLGNGGAADATGYDNLPIETTFVKIMDEVKTVAAGSLGGMAIKTDSSLWAWGDSTKQTYPVKIMEGVGAASGRVFVKLDGTLWTCGAKPVKIMDGVMLTPTAVIVSAAPTNSSVLVNGTAVAFQAYTINGNNYFKLRDLAMALTGTPKQFDVGWDGPNNAINLMTGKAYTPVGGELSGPADGTAPAYAVPSSSKVLLNGTQIQLTAYTIGGNNYFKLRDAGASINFGVIWDGTTNTIRIDTSTGYSSIQLNGKTYDGSYSYGGSTRKTVSFTISFKQNNDQISGTIVDAEIGKATFVGTTANGTMKFTKTYSDVSLTPIIYTGSYDASLSEIRGTWGADSTTPGGTFVIYIK